MDLMNKYLDDQILEYNLWISDPAKDIFQVQCLRLASFKPHPDFTGIMRGEIIMETWVIDDVNDSAPGWRQRPRMVLATNGNQILKSFLIVWDTIVDNNNGESSFIFNCKEDSD